MAVLALVGGLGLAYREIANTASVQPGTVEQKSEESKSPNIVTEGDVNITYGGSEKKEQSSEKK